MTEIRRVSVIIPVKNRAFFIGETLNNVLNQSQKPFEIIVVNDNSEDDLIGALQPFQNRIIYVENDGVGPGAARNTGLRISKGTYVQFFDSDDLMTSNKLQSQVDVLLNKPSDCFAYGPFVKANKYGDKWTQCDVVMQYYALPKSPSFFELVSRGWCPITQSALFPKSLLDRLEGWNEDVFTHEDLDFWFRLAEIEAVPIHTNEGAVIYRQHDDQLTNGQTDSVQFARNHVNVLSYWRPIVERECSFLTRFIFSARFNRSGRFSADGVNLSLRKLFEEWAYRVYNKIERINTGSDWEKMYGVNNEFHIFRKFIASATKS